MNRNQQDSVITDSDTSSSDEDEDGDEVDIQQIQVVKIFVSIVQIESWCV